MNTPVRWYAGKPEVEFEDVQRRVMLVLRLYDQIDPEKVTYKTIGALSYANYLFRPIKSSGKRDRLIPDSLRSNRKYKGGTLFFSGLADKKRQTNFSNLLLSSHAFHIDLSLKHSHRETFIVFHTKRMFQNGSPFLLSSHVIVITGLSHLYHGVCAQPCNRNR